MILKCNSAKCMAGHQQDKLHGPGRRVMNPTKAEGVYRCTVCSETQTAEKKRVDESAKASKKPGPAVVAGQRQPLPA